MTGARTEYPEIVCVTISQVIRKKGYTDAVVSYNLFFYEIVTHVQYTTVPSNMQDFFEN